MNLQQYIENVNKRFKSGISREHAYRADLENLIRELVPNVDITNEPSSVTDCGNPDYVITKGKIPIGFIEAKDVGKDLNHKQYKSQFDRYRKALDNLIITDYIWFQFYQDGKLVHEIRIADIHDGNLMPLPDKYIEFTNLIQDFCTFVSQTIKSPKRLAELMAAKARLLENILENAITSDKETEENTSLKQQYKTFQDILIHDLTPQGFADIYAQTLAYGMFAARLHDTTLDTFSRQEAAELIPKSNPFLRKLFSHVAGVDIDERIETTVDNLAEVFRATNVEELLKNFGIKTQAQDPIIHFYETFLAEYDPKLRKLRGVWYTPEPVVKFIVRSVDEILKTEFCLKDGLADTTKTKIKLKTDQPDRRTKSGYVEIDKEVHKVQVLDPATGTGTFLAEVVKFIYQKKFKAMQGAWSGYVDEHLIPRLNGFELLMASYSMAHLKLDMLLTQTSYKATKNQRFNIFLTNSLEEHHPDTGTLFSSWLSTEANEANAIKRDTPIMVVMGNPPYSGESANKGEWIMNLMEDYKKEPGGKLKLKEKNSKWINDDYVKFLRYGQHFIEKNGEGILAYINPHGFLDNPTFRGMRWNLLKTYDKIYTLDLHGNNKKKEVSPDGTPDVNVFDIEQGVSITFFIKTGKKKSIELGQVYHYGVYGSRNFKYGYLNDNSVMSIPYLNLPNIKPMFYFVEKNYKLLKKYQKFPALNEIFNICGNGVVTKRDRLCIHESKASCFEAAKDILSLDKNDFYNKYKLPDDVRDWRYEWAREDIKESELSMGKVKSISYRPFDIREIYYTGRSRGFVGWPVSKVMLNYVNGENIGLLAPKAFKDASFNHVFVTNKMSEAIYLSSLSGSNAMNFPLYLYAEKEGERISNINKEILINYEKILKIKHSDIELENSHYFSSLDVFRYIYAILHSPIYRKMFNEPLKTGFSRVPYPKTKENFFELAGLGQKLIDTHLLEGANIDEPISTYPVSGSDEITTKIAKKYWELYDSKNELGRIWINDEQCFDQIPLKAWEFYIGGYQPAQKWLKDRKGRKLNFDDILHYQKIIVSLVETDRIMQEIDKIDFM